MFKTYLDLKGLDGQPLIYCVRLRGSNQVYVGQTCNLRKRTATHLAYARNNTEGGCTKFRNAIQCYGEEEFELTVLCECDKSALNDLEAFYIKKLQAVKYGYNISPDPHFPISPETAKKISLANKGRKLTKEHKQKIGDQNRGRKHTAESRAKMSASQKGKKQSPELIAKRMAKQFGRKPSALSYQKLCERAKANRKPVEQIDPVTGLVMGIYCSISEAARATGSQVGNLTSALKGRLFTHHGFRWRYADSSSAKSKSATLQLQ